MTEYPDNYDTPVFPARRYLALTRNFAVWSGVLFLVILTLIGFFIWSANSMRMRPFLIAIDNDTGEWTVLSEKNTSSREYTAAHALQESVAGNFARRWFTITQNNSENEARWCRCDANTCGRNHLESGQPPCLVCCGSGPELYGRFTRDVLFDYRNRVAIGETWTLDDDTIHMHPLSEITENGGLWHLTAILNSSITGTQKIEAYVRVARSPEHYPLTMGFYVADFNAFLAGE